MEGQEFHFQVICGSCCLKAIKGWSSKSHIIRQRAIGDQKVYHPCHLSGVSPYCNLQWNDTLWINTISTKTDQWGSQGSEAFWIHYIYWKAVMCITSTKLPLSTNTLRVLNPSMVSIMTRGSYVAAWSPLHLTWRKQCRYSQYDDVLILGVWYEHYSLAFGLPFSETYMIPQWPISNDLPYLSHDQLEIVSIFFLMVISILS